LEKISEIRCRKTRSFLVIIVRNLCFNIFNEKKKVEYIPEYDAVEGDDKLSIEDYILRLEESDEIAKKLAALHGPYADILTLRFYHELSGAEIARVLGISEKNVGVRLHRAMMALRGILEERGDGLERSTKGRREAE
jgi:RNA polymerase sigma-70 factor (ECF subfamily)